MKKKVIAVALGVMLTFGTVVSYGEKTIDVDYNQLDNLLKEASNHPNRDDYLMSLREHVRSESGIDTLKEKMQTTYKEKLEKRGISVSDVNSALDMLKSYDQETRIALVDAVSDNNSDKILDILVGKEDPKEDSTTGGGGAPQEKAPNVEEKKEEAKKEEVTTNVPEEQQQEVKKECHFADIENHWAKDSIIHMASIGITSGIDEYTFAPQESLTRSQMVTFMVKLLDMKAVNEENLPFKDINKDRWDYSFVKAAYDANLVSGISKELFAPKEELTREQMMVMIMNALAYKNCIPKEENVSGMDSLEKVSDWAKDAIKKGMDLGIIDNNNEIVLEPQQKATRAEAMVMIEKVYELIKK